VDLLIERLGSPRRTRSRARRPAAT